MCTHTPIKPPLNTLGNISKLSLISHMHNNYSHTCHFVPCRLGLTELVKWVELITSSFSIWPSQIHSTSTTMSKVETCKREREREGGREGGREGDGERERDSYNLYLLFLQLGTPLLVMLFSGTASISSMRKTFLISTALYHYDIQHNN